MNEEGSFELGPLRKLDSRSTVKDYKVIYQVLIQWKGCSTEEATWEDEELLMINFPNFALAPCGNG